jgi:hypothetical protein
MRMNKKSRTNFKKYVTSIWFFPAILTLILIILSVLQINGSSMGVYHSYFYGEEKDPNLIANQPRYIRSDEWVVNTQKALAQKNNDFKVVNDNVGTGEDISLLSDAPYKDWSVIFKPHNFGFFVLPFDTAFALKWWMLSYFLILSTYFFILTILPDRKLLAILLSLGFLFSPFFQWWYLYGTLGTVYYTLFGLTVFIKLIHSRRISHAVGWGALLAYIGVSFAMILYPPFQIPCVIVAVAFLIGYVFDTKKSLKKLQLRNNLLIALAAVVLASLLVASFLYQKKDVVNAIQNTTYPGHRIIKSGGYDVRHLLSSQLSPLFQSMTKANHYSLPSIGATNQSESSNFILLLPLLIIPAIVIAFWRRKVRSYTIIALLGVSLVYTIWLFVPGMDFIGKITQLDKVPHNRALIGIGLLNLLMIVAFIKCYGGMKQKISTARSSVYALLVLVLILFINFNVVQLFPLFISYKTAILLAIPFAIIIFCLMRKYFISAAALLLLFGFLSTCFINPLYFGTQTLSETPVSKAIREVSGSSKKRWVSEQLLVENFASMNGRPSLTGAYLYPQLKLWDQLGQKDKENLYNRYAHVNFTFDRDEAKTVKPIINSPSPDQFNVYIEPCDGFLKKTNVGYLLTTAKFSSEEAPCLTLAKEVRHPMVIYYIYRVTF